MKSLRPLLVALVAASISFAYAAPLKYRVLRGKTEVGTATYEETKTDQGLRTSNTLSITEGGKTLTMESSNLTDGKGNTLSKENTIKAGEQTLTAKARIDAAGAIVEQNMAGNVSKFDVGFSTKTPRVNPSELWFTEIQPKAGTKITYQTFNMQTFKWEDVTLTYTGKRKVTLDGREVEGHELVLKSSAGRSTTTIVDDARLPLVIENGEFRTERILE